MLAGLTCKQLETKWVCAQQCTGTLVHQAISIYNADYIFVLLDQFHTETLELNGTIVENELTFWKQNYPVG